MHPKGERVPDTGLNLLDVCDGMTVEQLKVREKQQDNLVRSARERVLSARSLLTPSLSMRDLSRLSSRSARRDADEADDAKSYAGEADGGGQDLDTYHRSQYSTPDLYSESVSSHSHITHAKTLPDADMLRPEYRIDERPELRSYNSFSGDLPRKRLCMRSKSAVSREFDGVVNGLSRQCCDVLGPKVCHQCGLYRRRLMASQRHERPLSRLQTSERNFADSIILSKTLPNLTMEEIEDKVISGDISRISLRERVYLKRERTMQERAAKSRHHKEFVKDKCKTWSGVSSTFFMNIQDLNKRVLVGKLTNNLAALSDNSNSYWKPIQNAVKQTQELSVTEKLLPGFCSNKKTVALRPKSVEKYAPPLLPKVCQNVTPCFFAGAPAAYVLPDRLPEKVVEDQIDDFSAFDAAWSRSSSRAQSDQDAAASKEVLMEAEVQIDEAEERPEMATDVLNMNNESTAESAEDRKALDKTTAEISSEAQSTTETTQNEETSLDSETTEAAINTETV